MSGTLEHLARGRDIEYFCEVILGVKVNRAQRRWFRAILTRKGEWRTKFSVHVASNQVGKSLGVAILILYASVYKIGISIEDEKTWLDSPYNWFHVAPDQNQAYIPLRDIEALVAGSHLAQFDKAIQKYRPCRLPAGLVTFKKVEGFYDGMYVATGAVAQFRTTDEKAKALQGRRAHAISFDEAAFEHHLISVINETLLMRLISTDGPLFVVSTPDGINEYYELVESIKEPGIPVGDEGKQWETDEGRVLVWSTIDDNEGFGVTAEEIARMERDLDPATKEQQLRGAFLEPSEAFFTPTAQVDRAWTPLLPVSQNPIAGHVYVIFWDPSVQSDPTAGYVLDVTGKHWIVVREVWMRKPAGITSLITQMYGLHSEFSSARDELTKRQSAAITGFDETSMGGAIIGHLLNGLHPKRGLQFGGAGQVKMKVLSNLRAALMPQVQDDGSILPSKLQIPADMLGLKREILSYRLKDEKLVQDRVMALGGAAWLAAKGFSGLSVAKFSPSGRVSVVC